MCKSPSHERGKLARASGNQFLSSVEDFLFSFVRIDDDDRPNSFYVCYVLRSFEPDNLILQFKG